MLVIPAIDLLGGKVVRLHKGRRDESTVYHDRPDAVARRFQRQGATRLHVVDLDGAFSGQSENREAIARILGGVDVPVAVGGGVRAIEIVDELVALGARFVVLGTAAVRDPELVRLAAARHPGKVICAVDALDGRVRVAGWAEDSGESAEEVAVRAVRLGAAEILFTDIDRDGTRVGPNVASTAALQARLAAPVIASGGIGALDDLRALAAAGVKACVVGRAIYEGAFTLEAAIDAALEAAC
ncbi:MAG: 1-(5-phosphoribosyl)-5-[(5-phosphoribosylamino)methylideneamino]imidazole-4-carboxamide isomerase [Myxococcota bacterium]